MLRKTPYLLGTGLLLSTVAVFALISLVGIPRLMTYGATEQDPFAENQVAATVEVSADVVEPLVIQPSTAIPTTIATEIPKVVFAPSVTPDSSASAVELEAVAVAEESNEDVPVVTSDVVATAPEEDESVEITMVEPEPTEEAIVPRIRSTAKAWLYSAISGEDRWLGWYLAPDLTGSVLGRTPDGEWLLVEAEDGGVKGWVSAEQIEFVSGELRDVTLSNYSVIAWSDQEKPFADLVAESTAFEAPVAVAQLPAVATEDSQSQTQSQVTAWPTKTPWPTKIATPIPTETPWPTKTPWSTNTPEPVFVQPTATIPQPTATSQPTVIVPQPTATIKWVPTATVQPLPTAQPTATKKPLPTATRVPDPTATPAAVASAPDAVATVPKPVSESNAIAWWWLDRDSIQTGGGSWQFVMLIRVPTSFDYSFDIDNRSRTVRTIMNDDGDDYFELTLSGISCGSPFSAELLAYQNGARMIVQNEFTLVVGTVFINSPC